MNAEIIFSHAPLTDLREQIAIKNPDKVMFIMPDGCSSELLKVFGEVDNPLLINDSESMKGLGQLQHIWEEMLNRYLTRRSILVNIGGGVTTDMGGFAAACYMRGIDYINIPTTLLAMVDASAGGKTAVDFCGMKNIIGAFRLPFSTIISPSFLQILPGEQLLSGYAEMLKHAILQGEESSERLLAADPLMINDEEWMGLIRESVAYKERIVRADPKETGIRRVLNLGHTAGHAFESFSFTSGNPVTHGAAVAQGLVTALVLSVMLEKFPSIFMQQVAGYVKENYIGVPFGCDDYPELLSIMSHDKKNTGSGRVSFTLMSAPGVPVIAREVADDELKTALDITRDLLF